MTDEEKIRRYDELQTWFKWLEHRTRDGKTAKVTIETYLRGTKEFLKPYLLTEEEIKEHTNNKL